MKFRDLQVGAWFDFISPNRSHNSFFKRVEKTGPRTYRDEEGTKYRVGSISVQVYHVGGRWHAQNPRRKKLPRRSRDRLVGHSSNPRRRRKPPRRSRNPRSPLFKLLAHKRTGGKRLVYVGAAKFAEAGRPVYFKTTEGAKVVARLLRLQFPMLKRYAFSVAGA
jgi:hypothetical protein